MTSEAGQASRLSLAFSFLVSFLVAAPNFYSSDQEQQESGLAVGKEQLLVAEGPGSC
jgi:hypothetical protein